MKGDLGIGGLLREFIFEVVGFNDFVINAGAMGGFFTDGEDGAEEEGPTDDICNFLFFYMVFP